MCTRDLGAGPAQAAAPVHGCYFACQLHQLCTGWAVAALGRRRTLQTVFQRHAGGIMRRRSGRQRTMVVAPNPIQVAAAHVDLHLQISRNRSEQPQRAGQGLPGCKGMTSPFPALLLPPTGFRTQPCCAGLAIHALLRIGLPITCTVPFNLCSWTQNLALLLSGRSEAWWWHCCQGLQSWPCTATVHSLSSEHSLCQLEETFVT